MILNRKRLFAAALALTLATAVPASAAGMTPLPRDPDAPKRNEIPHFILPSPDAPETTEGDDSVLLIAPAPDAGEDGAIQALPDSTGEDGAVTPITSTPDVMEDGVEVLPPYGGYATVITVNGKPLEEFSFSRSIPGWGSKSVTWRIDELDTVPVGYVPMRAIAQADHGNAYWSREENLSWFVLAGHHIDVYFDDMSIVIEDQPVEGASALLVNGTTYLPVSVIDGLEGCSVTDLSADGVERYDISTPNGEPLMALAYELQDLGPLAAGGKTSSETFEQFYGDATGFKAEYVTEFVAFTPMNTTPDTLIMGKPTEGALEEIQAAMEAYRQTKEDTFSWYLGWNLPKVQDARFVTEGDWFFFYIGENADAVVEAFRAGVPGLE